MKRILLVLTILFCNSMVTAAELVIENDHIRVVIDSQTAAWRVIDKRAKYIWQQTLASKVPQLVLARCTDITVDGDLSDWEAIGAPHIAVKRLTAGVKPKVRDCSASFRAAWDENYVYFAVEVTDDIFVEPESSAVFWHGDTVELWIGSDQFGVGMAGGKPFVVCYNRAAAAKGAKAAIRKYAGGWTCEAALAIESLVATVARKQPTPLAVGVNDADQYGQRESQQYYPSTWKQWDTNSYVLAAFTGRAGKRAERALPILCSSAKVGPNRHSIVLTMPELAGRGSDAVVTFKLERNVPEVLIKIDGDRTASIANFTFPEPLLASTPAAAWVVPQQEGILYRVHGDRYPPANFQGMMSMPWIGAVDLKTGVGYMIIAETPDDMRFDKRNVTVGGERLFAGAPTWLPQKGKLGYPRRARYVFFDRGGYVAMCKRYRTYAKSISIARTLADKAHDLPNVRKLAGAVDIWYTRQGDVVKMAKTLKSLGIDRCLMHISSVGYLPTKTAVESLRDMGYLVGHYDIYTDLHESGHKWDKWARYAQYHFPKPVIRKADGSLQSGWYTVYDKGKPYRSFVVCSLEGLRALRQRVPTDHAAAGHSAWFIDCTTSCGLYECYAHDHPATRTQDKEAKLAQFKFLYDNGLVCGSEGGRDWALRYASYFEGIMSTATWHAAPKNMSHVGGPLDVTDKYMEFDHGPSRRLPLWELVHHDTSYVTWWWGDGQLRVPANWWLKDLWNILYGTMPLWMMRDEGTRLFIENPDAFRDSYARVSPVTRAVFGIEMLSHKFLSEDCNVQQTRWANGLSVTVNFGPKPQTVDGGLRVPGYSYRLDGDATRLNNLPLGKPIIMPHNWKPKRSKGILNADFSAGDLGWRAMSGISLSIIPRSHNGRNAAKFDGTNESDWILGHSMSVFRLQPGKRYHFGAWMKITRLDPANLPPWLAIAITGDKGWITNIHTHRYDPKQLGTWQRLETSFLCPDNGNTGKFNIEKFNKQSITITLLLAEPFFETE